MSILRKIMRTSDPGGVLLLRLAVGAPLLLDGARVLKLKEGIGASRLASVSFLPSEVPMWMGVLELLLGVLLVVGFLTRVGAAATVAIAVVAVMAAKSGGGGLDSAQSLTLVVHGTSLALVALYLTVRGGGVWSIDASAAARAKQTEKA